MAIGNPKLLPLVLVAMALAGLVPAQTSEPGKVSSMNPKVVEEAGFTVIGISARTSNARETTDSAVIPKQWARFMQENLLAQIPNRTDSSIVVVYSNYASDRNGEYSYLIGARSRTTEELPAGMVARRIGSGRYAIFTSDKGPVAKVVPDLWRKIWAVPKSAPGGDRAYQTDYEVYDERAADPQNAQVDVHVGIR
jgi:predicted transcriptional regulator YdeE